MANIENLLYPRFVASLVTTALQDTPVVMVTGPRQCGKTTLVRNLVAEDREFFTMDDDTILASARSDPSGLVRGLDEATLTEISGRRWLVLTALPELAVSILEYAREHGRVTMADMIRSTGASRNTLKEHFRKLVELQQLALYGNRKGSWYSLK